jgi:hypothetical protein
MVVFPQSNVTVRIDNTFFNDWRIESMMMHLPLDPRQTQIIPNIEDLKLAASKMKQEQRRVLVKQRPCLDGDVPMSN